jgi:glycosyltransferase involved in cell wall biosynthesis
MRDRPAMAAGRSASTSRAMHPNARRPIPMLACRDFSPGKGKRSVTFAETCASIVTVGTALRHFPRAVVDTIKACRAERPDIIVCSTEDIALALGWIAARCTGRAYWVVAEDPPFTARYDGRLGLRLRIERRLRLWLLRRLLAASRGVFCFIAPDVLDEARTEQMRIIALRTGTSETARAWVSGPCRDRQRLQGPAYTIGYVGAIDAEQGIPALLQAVAAVRPAVPHIRVKLIGPLAEADRDAFDAALALHGLRDAVTVTGWLSYGDMLHALSLCDVGCFLRKESLWARSAFPLKVCEYLALAKPVIAWDYPGCARLLEHGRYGILVPGGEIASLAGALVMLADDNVRSAFEARITAASDSLAADNWYSELLRIAMGEAAHAADQVPVA